MWVIWVDAAAAVLGLSVLSVVALRLYRRVKHVSATLAEASATIGELTAALDQIGPPPRRGEQ